MKILDTLSSLASITYDAYVIIVSLELIGLNIDDSGLGGNLYQIITTSENTILDNINIAHDNEEVTNKFAEVRESLKDDIMLGDCFINKNKFIERYIKICKQTALNSGEFQASDFQ